MRIFTGRKTLGHDGNKYREYIEITVNNTQKEDMFRNADKMREGRRQQEVNKVDKKKRAGLRKCPGHKFPKVAQYSDDGQCSVCKGYKKNERI